jgi:hypothetical protein
LGGVTSSSLIADANLKPNPFLLLMEISSGKIMWQTAFDNLFNQIVLVKYASSGSSAIIASNVNYVSI